MEPGLVVDKSHGGVPFEQRWVKGQAETSFWTNGLKTKGREILAVKTFRCERCGYLESYATTPVKI